MKTVYYNFIDSFRYRAKKRHIPFTLKTEDIEKLLEKQEYKCALTGDELTIPLKKGKTNASLDRIDSNQGYHKDNVQITTKDANLAKQRLSMEDFLELCEKILKKHNRIPNASDS